MKANKILKRYMAGWMCAAMVIGSALPPMSVMAEDEVPVTKEIVLGEGTGQEVQSEYIYEDGNLQATVKLTVPESVPAGSVLKVREVTANNEATSNWYTAVSSYMEARAEADEFQTDGFISYEIYFESEGQEIVPSEGMMNVSMSYKADNVPEAYVNSQGAGKEVKLYQIQDETAQGGNVYAADLSDSVTRFDLTGNGSVGQMEFGLKSYLPLVLTWKENKAEEPKEDPKEEPKEEPKEQPKEETYSFTYSAAMDNIQAIATIDKKNVLPESAQLKVKETVTEERESFYGKLYNQLSNQGKAISSYNVYDIGFENAGSKIEPNNGSVQVTLKYTKAVTLSGKGDIRLYHEKQDGTIEEIVSIVKTDNSGNVESVTFNSGEFSNFALLRSEAKRTNALGNTRSAQPEEPVHLSKTAVYNEETDSAEIKLESYATGVLQQIEKSKGLDVVMLLDVSQSMGQSYGKTTLINALKSSALKFANMIIDNGGEHRIAVATFGSSGTSTVMTNTGGDIIYNRGEVQNALEAAFCDVTVDKQKNTLLNNISSVVYDPNGGTATDVGLEIGQQILKYDKRASDKTRKKIVIMFTDGEPNMVQGWGTKPIPNPESSIDFGPTNSAIQNAKSIKDGGASLYTIGVSNIADAKDQNYLINRFLHYVSSNFPNATGINAAGTNGNAGNGYYQVAGNESELDAVFEKIYEDVGSSSTTLDDTTVVFDTISDSFENPVKNNVAVYTSEYLGKDSSGGDLWDDEKELKDAKVNIQNNQIKVSGFDYKNNYVAYDPVTKHYEGSKLVVRITAVRKDGFIGGNAVFTNGEATIQDADGNNLLEFNQPTVDIPLRFETEPNDTDIYIGDSLQNAEEFFESDGKIRYTYGTMAYTIDGINNKYVDITYTLYDESAKPVGNYIVAAGETTGAWVAGSSPDLKTEKLTADQKYKVRIVVTPIQDGKIIAKTLADKTALLHVFVPAIQVTDKVLFYGDNTNLNDRLTKTNDNVKIEWKCSDGARKPTKTAPELSYLYTSVKGTELKDQETAKKFAADQDTQIKMTVKNGEIDITAKTAINNASSTHDAAAKDYNFTIYVVKGQLDITKKIDVQYTDAEALNSNQSFIFKVERRDSASGAVTDTYYTTVNFDANADGLEKTETMYGLKKGYYTITEETAWASKYELKATSNNYNDKKDNTVQVVIGDDQGKWAASGGKSNMYGTASDKAYEKYATAHPAAVTFENEADKDWKWLSDAAAAINKFVK